MSEKAKQQLNNYKEEVLKKIRTGEVVMRPRIFFMLKVLALGFVALLVLLTSALLISFILFSLYVSGHMLLLGFGLKGLETFLLLFPWWLVLVEAILLIILESLIQRFKFGYRSPLMYLIFGTLVVTISAGLLINATSLHSTLLRRAEHRNLPYLGGYYDHLRAPMPGRGIFRGVIRSIDGTTLVLDHSAYDPGHDDPILKITVTSEMLAVAGAKVGDTVFIAGTKEGGQIHAYGIQKITDDMDTAPETPRQ